jgi:hypothetical protein
MMPKWLLLTHQLPSEPSNIRVKIWRKLQDLGAVPVKNSIYVLPNRPGTREDFGWLKKEIIGMKGEASIFLADSITDVDEKEIVKAFQEARSKDYEKFIKAIHGLTENLRSALGAGPMNEERISRIEKEATAHKIQWERLEKIDFFKAPKGAQAKDALESIQKLLGQLKALSVRENPEPPSPLAIKSLKGLTWVTRASPHIDRMACAWLIQRRVDPKARFKFVKEPYRGKAREIRFDMAEGEFTHFGDWCSFETFLHRLGLKDPALTEMAEIIHDIDLKDKKFGRLEASGLSRIILGLCRMHKDDFVRIQAGINVFDALYASLEPPP